MIYGIHVSTVSTSGGGGGLYITYLEWEVGHVVYGVHVSTVSMTGGVLLITYLEWEVSHEILTGREFIRLRCTRLHIRSYTAELIGISVQDV